MTEVRLDARRWRNGDDLYDDLLPALGALPWHGRNLDAVWDSLVGGDIVAAPPPYLVRIVGDRPPSADLGDYLRRLVALLHEAILQGAPLTLEVDPRLGLEAEP